MIPKNPHMFVWESLKKYSQKSGIIIIEVSGNIPKMPDWQDLKTFTKLLRNQNYRPKNVGNIFLNNPRLLIQNSLKIF